MRKCVVVRTSKIVCSIQVLPFLISIYAVQAVSTPSLMLTRINDVLLKSLNYFNNKIYLPSFTVTRETTYRFYLQTDRQNNSILLALKTRLITISSHTILSQRRCLFVTDKNRNTTGWKQFSTHNRPNAKEGFDRS